MEYSTFGRHIIVDLWGVDFSLLNDIHFLEHHLVAAANHSGAHVLNVSSKEFHPYGVTVLVLGKPSLYSHFIPKRNLQRFIVILVAHLLNQELLILLIHISLKTRTFCVIKN